MHLKTFQRPYNWAEIDAAVLSMGGAILQDLLTEAELAGHNQAADDYVIQHLQDGLADTGSAGYDAFLGRNTIRLHGLIEKLATSAELIGDPQLFAWASRMLAPVASSVLLNAAELIQIQPPEPAQLLHRDSDSWPLPIDEHPVVTNAIIAFDDFTAENGATVVVPGSWQWPMERRAKPAECVQAIMCKGSALLFRGDMIHAGGENSSKKSRRALSISYCAGWLRPVENSYLNVSKETASALPDLVKALLGYTVHDGSKYNGGVVGLYENGDPMEFFQR
jgi:ectoine hydroxylase-related dioxygenase (phytanoyl-CoA dioxygenase family)